MNPEFPNDNFYQEEINKAYESFASEIKKDVLRYEDNIEGFESIPNKIISLMTYSDEAFISEINSPKGYYSRSLYNEVNEFIKNSNLPEDITWLKKLKNQLLRFSLYTADASTETLIKEQAAYKDGKERRDLLSKMIREDLKNIHKEDDDSSENESMDDSEL